MDRVAGVPVSRTHAVQYNLDAVCSDLRYAFRSFRWAPAFFALVIGILALGIGAAVSVFSLVDGVLLRPLPNRDPGRLVMLTVMRRNRRTIQMAPFPTRISNNCGPRGSIPWLLYAKSRPAS
ncbi:MAG TPA: hypothetical protein VHU83_04480 [Bryobacteraceae bacterium]|nr:hypothetical protein [Bryobacteraceae bacterium]